MLGNPLKQNERVNLQLEFDLENVNGSESSLEFKVVVNTTSIDLNNNNATDPLKLRVVVVEKTMLSITGYLLSSVGQYWKKVNSVLTMFVYLLDTQFRKKYRKCRIPN